MASKVTDREGYLRATKYYFDCIIGPYKRFMLAALKRVRQLELDMICPGHGPVLDCNIPWMLDTYEEWSTVINPNPRTTVIIPYVSAYGYTGKLAQAIAQGVKESGDIDVRTYDMVEADAAKVAEGAAVRRRLPAGHAHHCGRGPQAHLGPDHRHVRHHPRRQAGQRLRQLRLERRGRAPHHGAAQAAEDEDRGALPGPVQAQRGADGAGQGVRPELRPHPAGQPDAVKRAPAGR